MSLQGELGGLVLMAQDSLAVGGPRRKESVVAGGNNKPSRDPTRKAGLLHERGALICRNTEQIKISTFKSHLASALPTGQKTLFAFQSVYVSL